MEGARNRSPRRVAALAAIAALALAIAPVAHARPSPKKAIWGPVERNGDSQFPIYKKLGVRIYQTSLSWRDVATARPAHPRDPADPAYRWPAELGRAVRLAHASGMRVMVSVMNSPGWANGGRAGSYAPKRPADYARFVAA